MEKYLENNLKKQGNVVYVYSPLLERTGIVHHGVSTRIGGHSDGCYSSMNLSYNLGDDKSVVHKNYKDFCNVIGVEVESLVPHKQVHYDEVKVIDDLSDYLEIYDFDGMVTNKKGITLDIYSADCVPVLFVDEKVRTIGACHSGWKGTVKNIAKKTATQMKISYNTNISYLKCFIGPAICAGCFEVGEEVYDEFHTKPFFDEKFATKKSDGKYLLDLKSIIKLQLLQLGVKEQNIDVCNHCTMCDERLFFSHRRNGLKRGSHLTVIALK